MNLYNYWLKLKQLYPAAVAAGVAHFRETHREAWRTHFKDPDNILSWLDTCQIQIQTFKKTPPKNRPNSHSPGDGLIRFELSATTTRDAALYDANAIAIGIAAWLAGCDLAGYKSDNFDVPMLVESRSTSGARAGVTFSK